MKESNKPYQKKLIGHIGIPVSDLRQSFVYFREDVNSELSKIKRITEEVDEEMYKDIIANKGEATIKRFADYYNSLPVHPIRSKAEAQRKEYDARIEIMKDACNSLYNKTINEGNGVTITLDDFDFKDGEVVANDAKRNEKLKEYRAIYLHNQEQEDLYNRCKQMAEELNELQEDLRKEYPFEYVVPFLTAGSDYKFPLYTGINSNKVEVNIDYFYYPKR